jgi:hypothetical protein
MTKLQLLLGGKPLNGYLALDPTAQPNDSSRVLADLTKLDQYVDNNECEEVLALDIIDYFPLQARQPLIIHWLTKVAHGGTFVLSSLDLHEYARLLHNGSFQDVVQYNQLLFGGFVQRKSTIPLDDTVKIIQSTGQMVIEEIKYNNVFYIVKAKRK